MKIRTLFVLLLLFISSSITERIMAHEIEDNKIVTIAVKYKEERGIIKVNNEELKNGQSLSVEYGSSISVTIIPNEGYCAGPDAFSITPSRSVSALYATNINPYNTKPMTFVFNEFIENMVFDYTFYQLYSASIEVRDDGGFDGYNCVVIDGKTVNQDVSAVSLRYMRNIEMEFVERDGFYLKQVLIDDIDKISEVRENKLKLYDPPRSIKVKYGRKDGYYSIKYENEENGYIKVNEDYAPILLPASSQVKISFYPISKSLKKCLLNGVDVLGKIKNRELIIPSITEDLLFQFAFGMPPLCKVSYNSGGEVEVNDIPITNESSIPVSTETDVRISMIPQIGFYLKAVMVGDNSWSQTNFIDQVSNNILTIPSVLSNKSIGVIFAPKTYTVQVLCNEGGDVEVNEKRLTNDGKLVSINALMDVKVVIKSYPKYRVKQVKLGNEDVTKQLNNNVLIIPSILEDKNISVIFEKICTIKVSSSEGGHLQFIDNNGVVYSGSLSSFSALTDVQVIIIPDNGYHLKQLRLGTVDVTSQVNNNKFSIFSISEDKDITVTFEKDTPVAYIIKVTYTGDGNVKLNDQAVLSGNSILVNASTDMKVIITPSKGYHLKQVKLGIVDVTKQVRDNLLIIPSISANQDLSISFEKDEPTSFTFRIFYYGSGNGSVMVNGNMAPNGYSITVPVTKKIELIFQSDEGYYLKQAMLGSVDITKQIVDNHYTIPALSSDASLSVTFEKIPTYSLNINMVDGSSSIKINEKVITNSTQITEIKEGSPILLNFMPSKYYAIKNVTLGDKNITGLIKDGFYEIKSIKSNLSLQVEYSKKEYTLSLTSLQGIERIRIGNTEHYDKSSFILTPGIYNLAIFSNSNYLITQVLSEGEKLYDNLEGESSYFGSIDIDHDKEITILLKLREKRERTVVLEQPGTLSSFLTEEDMNLITHLRVEGKIDQRDFVVINQMKLLSKLSLEASIVNYSIYPANTIPEKAFYNNRNIQTIYLPNSIESIDKQAFYGSFISLLEASGDSYKHLNKIGEEAFKNCQYLIEAPLLITNVPVIEKGVFENCSNLITFSTSLPNLVEIKESAFRNCKKLCLSFESSLERIGDYAFENMKSVNFYSWIEEAKLSYLSTNALKGCPTDNFDFTNYPYLKELPVFEGCSKMVSITFPPNVKRISTNTFKGCTSLQHVHMNEKIEYIAENAFCDCKGITNLYVPINKAPEVFANSFSDFNYVLAKLVVPADYMYFYRYHTVWGKFNNIEYFGENSVRQIQTVISQGGFVKLKGENNISFDETICREGIYFNLYPTSSRVELIVEPEEGYSTESVILNGENVTNRLDKNYKFVIPYLLDDTELEVKFKKDNSTDIEIINTKKRVYISDSNQLSLAGFRIGIYVSVYDTSGRLITQRILQDNMEKISLPCKGIYFIKVGKEAFKIIY